MINLAAGKCIPCRGGESSLTESEISDLMLHIPRWQTVIQDGVPRLQRVFTFKNYAHAVEFTIRIAAIAVEEDHHPLIVLEWGRVIVQWWTHVVKGLHKNDFVMAAKTDEFFNQQHG